LSHGRRPKISYLEWFEAKILKANVAHYPKQSVEAICRMKLLARSLRRVMVGNQPPASLLLYPHPGKASVTGNSLAFVLPNHCCAASLHSRVSIDAHLNVIGGDRLKFQITRREIRNHLRLGSHCAAWPYADKIISVDTVKGHRISTDLRLNAFIIQLPYGLLDAASLISVCALLLP